MHLHGSTMKSLIFYEDHAVTKKTGKNNLEDTLHFVEELKRQWVATLDALIDPLMIIGPDYVIQKANVAAAKMAGVEVRKVVGMKCHQALAGRAKPCPGCKLQETLKQSKPHQFPLADVVPSRVFEVSSQPLTKSPAQPSAGGDGETAVVHIYRDRTEAAMMQSRLIQSEKLASIGLLAGGIAHEINNPLGGIMIFSQMLLREMPKDSPHYSDVQEIEAAAQRCKQIVQGLLDFARVQPGSELQATSTKKSRIDAREAVESALRFARINVKQKQNIHIRENFTAQDSFVLGDKNQIIQVILNLVQNAVQAMPAGGELTIAITNDAKKENVLIEVTDTGEGIKPADLSKIFDPFFTTKQPGEGTGLGLAICYGIITGMGGRLTATSKPGSGSTFTVSLPLSPAP